MKEGYVIREQGRVHFITITVVDWIDVFTRIEYFDIITDSLAYCRKNKGMVIFGYCIMPNHIHLIFRSRDGKPSELIRDFKGFTSKKMLNAIKGNLRESRREWMLWMFKKAGSKRSNVTEYQFWQQDNHPIEIWSLKVFEQKLNYTHNNPVKAGFVMEPWEWKYSSARNYCDDYDGVLKIDVNL